MPTKDWKTRLENLLTSRYLRDYNKALKRIDYELWEICVLILLKRAYEALENHDEVVSNLLRKYELKIDVQQLEQKTPTEVQLLELCELMYLLCTSEGNKKKALQIKAMLRRNGGVTGTLF